MAYSDPSLPLQKAIVARLKSDPAVDSIIGGRIFDYVPPETPLPYISFGPFQMLPEHGDCMDGGEAFITLDAWAGDKISVTIKQLGTAIAKALDRAELALEAPQAPVELSIEQIQYMRDPDGITTHASITVHAWTEPA